MDEIGHSAFSLLNIAEERAEHAKREARRQAAAESGEAEEEEEEDIKPTYPRSMLRFELSDGTKILHAFEYVRLPDIELGVTPIGYKFLVNKVYVRDHRAFLEPANITPKGGSWSKECVDAQEDDLVRYWKQRMRIAQNDPPAPPPQVHVPPAAAPQAALINPRMPVAPARAPSQPPIPSVRSPLREISEPPEPSHTFHDDDEQQPRRRKVPPRNRSPSPPPPPRPRPTSTRSKYFDADDGDSKDKGKQKQKAGDLARELIFSPHRNAPIIVDDSDDEFDNLDGAEVSQSKGKGKRKESSVTVQVRYDPDPEVPESGDASSEYGFDEEFPDEVMAELDRVEEEHIQEDAIRSQTQTQTQTQLQQSGTTLVGTSRTTATNSQATLVAGRRSQSRGVGGVSHPGATQSRRPPPQDIDFIDIDDDEDEEKENIAVPTRHTRRRIDPDEVIVLSSD
ncbi:hypothetical protein EUX98_g962 [Antrodiella citrinella]|uniref:RecQ-mediated genome instability protein 1 n=1 Tax=Antrodiella citrinella TaxID=2447956 RepID=A0A4S4N5N7_9APHY|nr:hypothetical protein EUX98_g962 [Antrodiella citrinella]